MVSLRFNCGICLGIFSLVATGCCGVIPNIPAKLQADYWIHQGLPPGTNASSAKLFLESKGFEVSIVKDRTPHEMRAFKIIGACLLNFTYDTLRIESKLDKDGRVGSSKSYLGIAPGI